MKFALLTNVSFKFGDDIKSFDSFDKTKIEKYLDGKISFHEFNGTKDLFIKTQEIIGKGTWELENCNYDKNILIQALYFNTSNNMQHEKLIIIKRKIHDKDTYTFLDFDVNKSDNYEYFDITLSDIISIIRSKHIRKGLVIYANGKIDEVELLDTQVDNITGRILVSPNTSVEYLNLPNLLMELHEKNYDNDKINEILTKHLQNTKVNHMFTRKENEIVIINYICQTIGFIKNNIMSDLLNDNFAGDAIVWLESKSSYDERILDLTSELLDKIINKTKPKKTIFFNIYRDL
jgi:hypothetical protein